MNALRQGTKAEAAIPDAAGRHHHASSVTCPSMEHLNNTPLDLPGGDSGWFSVRELVRFALFIDRPHREIASSMVRAIDGIIDAFPPPALSMFSVESGDWAEFDAQGLKSRVHARLIGSDRPINGCVSLSGNQANIPDFQLDYLGYALDRPAFRTGSCALWFQVGASVCGPYLDRALRMWEHLVVEVDATSGYVELALEGDRRRMQVMAGRYLNEDICDISSVSEDLAGKLPGAYWRTYLGSGLARAMGGADALSATLSSEAQIRTVPTGGLLLTLGDAPVRGDRDRQETTPDRCALARLAHGRGLLSVPGEVIYFEATEGQSDSEAQEAWHLRHVL